MSRLPARRRFLHLSTGCALAAHLLNRLGYGPRPGDLARVAADPWALSLIHI